MVTFAAWSAAVVAAGALAVAALLFALQRLRIQRRRVAMAATPLWSQVARDAPPRVLGGRFRRPIAYLLALAIALALWLAASRPEPSATPTAGVQALYLDTSALMTGGTRMADAQAALIRAVAAAPVRARTVYLGDAAATILLAPGEDGALLPARLSAVRAGLRPSTFARWLGGLDPRAVVIVRYFGARAVFDAAPRPGGAVQVVPGYLTQPVADNRGIVDLGVSPAASGAADRADALVTLFDGRSRALGTDDVRVRLGGDDWAPPRVDAASGGRFILRDVPAAGQVLEVALRRGDAFAADDAAAIVVPDRRPVRVAIGAGVPDTIRRAVQLDPALRIVAAEAAQVAIRRADAPAGRLPALLLTDPTREAATFVVTTPAGEDQTTLADRLDALGLRGLDAVGLADALGRPVAVRQGAPATVRSVAVWRQVFDARSGFARSATLPLFVSQTLRWLAAPAPWFPYAKAGERLPDQSALYGLADDPAVGAAGLGDGIYLADAGATTVAGRPVAVALIDRETSRLAAAAAREGATVAVPDGAYPDLLLPVLLLLAAGLLAVEWRLVQRGWMP